MTQQEDLDWDHSAGEQLTNQNYSLLDDTSEEDQQYCSGIAPFYDHTSGNNKEQYVTLSKRQLNFLLRTLEDAESLLKAKASTPRVATRQYQRSTPAIYGNESFNSTSKCSAAKCFGFFMKYNLFVTLVLQSVMLICVTVLDVTESSWENRTANASKQDAKNPMAYPLSSYTVMSTLIALNLLMVIYISARTVRNMFRSVATTWMLSQAYLSTLLVFASLYTITYRIDVHGWTLHGFNKERDDNIETIVAYLYLKMFYHSISTSTLCGASIIHPDAWYNFILMAFQMLLSFVYFTSILSQVIGTGGLRTANKTPERDNLPTPALQRHNSCQSIISRESIYPTQENNLGERRRLLNNASADFSRYDAL